MTSAATTLERECDVFTRFLTRSASTPYVLAKYRAAHGVAALSPVGRMDALLLAVARWSRLTARLADAYARVLVREGALRRKLVLLLAIVESAPSLHRVVTEAPHRTAFAACATLALAGAIGVATLFVSVMVFGPIHVVMAAAERRS